MGDYVQSSLSAEVAPSRGRSDGLAASTALAAVAQYARSCGVSDDDLSDALGWSVHALYDPTNRLPDYLGAVLISKLVDLGVGSAPPLDIAEKASISFFSGVERTMILARNGRHALQSFERRIDVIADRLLAAFDETERSVALVFRHPVDDAHNGSCNDVMLAMTARMMRYIVGPHARLKEVRSGYSPNGPRARYDETFGVPVRFNNASGEFLLVYEKDGMLWDNPCHEPSL